MTITYGRIYLQGVKKPKFPSVTIGDYDTLRGGRGETNDSHNSCQ